MRKLLISILVVCFALSVTAQGSALDSISLPTDTICCPGKYRFVYHTFDVASDTLASFVLEHFDIQTCQLQEQEIWLVPQQDTTYIYDTICYGESYQWNEKRYSDSTTDTVTLSGIYGCDSVAILYLTVLPKVVTITKDTLLCHGETCHWREKNYSTAGTYRDTIYNQLGCDSVVYTLELAYLPEVVMETTDTLLCYGETCEWRDSVYSVAGVYHDTIYNQLGCDSVIYTLKLTYLPEIPITHVVDTMAGPTYIWHDKTYSQGGDYMVVLASAAGCDSIVQLHLVDNEAAIDTAWTSIECAGEGTLYLYTQTQGFIDSLIIRPNRQMAGYIQTDIALSSTGESELSFSDMKAGAYPATLLARFHQQTVAEYPIQLTFMYPNTIFEQRYNDLIAILTHDYNGGYRFTAYEWYKDGIRLEGENKSYLNQPLDFEAEYSVMLTDSNGVEIMSCPIVPENRASMTVYPTIIKAGESIVCHVDQPTRIELHDVYGKRLLSLDMKEGKTPICVDQQPGVYLLRFMTNDSQLRQVKIIVR